MVRSANRGRLSKRRACSIVNAYRNLIRYRSCRPPDKDLHAHLLELANERKRFVYGRLFILLRRKVKRPGRRSRDGGWRANCRKSLLTAPIVRNDFTTTKITIPIISTVRTALILR